jgi:hypothetical protein
MGLTAHKDGISVQFCDANGDPNEPRIFGKAVALRGAPRAALTAANPLGDDERAKPGSDDWLTVVAVADTQDRLDALTANLGPGSGPNTSAFSRRVEIRTHVGNSDPRTESGRITLAEGDVLNAAEFKLEVHVLKVMAAGTVVDARHPLVDKFDKAQPFSVKSNV